MTCVQKESSSNLQIKNLELLGLLRGPWTPAVRDFTQGKNYTEAPGDFAPEMLKRALENHKRAPENCHRLQCKSLFNVADLVNGM